MTQHRAQQLKLAQACSSGRRCSSGNEMTGEILITCFDHFDSGVDIEERIKEEGDGLWIAVRERGCSKSAVFLKRRWGIYLPGRAIVHCLLLH